MISSDRILIHLLIPMLNKLMMKRQKEKSEIWIRLKQLKADEQDHNYGGEYYI